MKIAMSLCTLVSGATGNERTQTPSSAIQRSSEMGQVDSTETTRQRGALQDCAQQTCSINRHRQICSLRASTTRISLTSNGLRNDQNGFSVQSRLLDLNLNTLHSRLIRTMKSRISQGFTATLAFKCNGGEKTSLAILPQGIAFEIKLVQSL
jgi:hypothetical protein